jgi:hypothetical protein
MFIAIYTFVPLIHRLVNKVWICRSVPLPCPRLTHITCRAYFLSPLFTMGLVITLVMIGSGSSSFLRTFRSHLLVHAVCGAENEGIRVTTLVWRVLYG